MWPKYEKPFFFHFRFDEDMRAFNAATVCMTPCSTGEGKFKAGLALCSTLDNFSKKIGRCISEGRARSGEQIIEAQNLESLKEKASQLIDRAENEFLCKRRK